MPVRANDLPAQERANYYYYRGQLNQSNSSGPARCEFIRPNDDDPDEHHDWIILLPGEEDEGKNAV